MLGFFRFYEGANKFSVHITISNHFY